MNVERDSQKKKILIGHKGEMIKKIGTEAPKGRGNRGDLGSKIYLGMSCGEVE